MPKQLTKQTSLGLALPPRAGAEEPVALLDSRKIPAISDRPSPLADHFSLVDEATASPPPEKMSIKSALVRPEYGEVLRKSSLPTAKPNEKLKKIPVNRMRQRIRKLPPAHYTLYRSAVSLLEYTYRLIEKFPKSEKLALAHDIRRRTEDVVELVLEAVSFYSKDKNREALLRTTDIHLKMIAVLVEYAYKKRYITDQNLTAWANKLCTLDDEVIAWAMNIAKQAKSSTIKTR